MFCLNENNIYHFYSQGIDMRKGVEGLCSIIRTYQYSPTNQEVYVLANKSRTLVKMLHWERGGFVVYYKRLEQGRLSPSIFHHKNAAVFIDIRWDEMVLLMEGIRLGTTPKSSLGEAISYTLKRWDKLCAYVTNGMYNIDNNPVKRSIRPIALGRKNWLFIKSDESGEDLAVISTLIQTCELLGKNPKYWLSKTFSKIVGQNNYDPETLLPYHYV